MAVPVKGGMALFRRHPALAVTLGYLALSVTGMIFSWAYYREFGINYFLFAEIGDFLLAVAREPITLLAAAVGVGGIVLVYAYAKWELRKLREREANLGWFGRAYLKLYLRMMNFTNHIATIAAMMVMYIFLFVTIYAEYQARQVQGGNGTAVTVQLTGAEGVYSLEALLIGTSGRFLFLYDPAASAAVVVPHESIASLRVGPEPRSRSRTE